jgi:hypothetical protein
LTFAQCIGQAPRRLDVQPQIVAAKKGYESEYGFCEEVENSFGDGKFRLDWDQKEYKRDRKDKNALRSWKRAIKARKQWGRHRCQHHRTFDVGPNDLHQVVRPDKDWSCSADSVEPCWDWDIDMDCDCSHCKDQLARHLQREYLYWVEEESWVHIPVDPWYEIYGPRDASSREWCCEDCYHDQLADDYVCWVADWEEKLKPFHDQFLVVSIDWHHYMLFWNPLGLGDEEFFLSFYAGVEDFDPWQNAAAKNKLLRDRYLVWRNGAPKKVHKADPIPESEMCAEEHGFKPYQKLFASDQLRRSGARREDRGLSNAPKRCGSNWWRRPGWKRAVKARKQWGRHQHRLTLKEAA